MISIDEALQIIYENTKRLGSITVRLNDAYGMVLALDVYSDMNIPPFKKSAVDGFAVNSENIKDVPTLLKIKETIAAGSIEKGDISSGECVKIMTGAPVPYKADAVVMIEDTETTDDGKVRIMKNVIRGENICRKGEDVKEGELVLKKGSLIGGAETAILSSVGKNKVKVYKKPSIGIISTGNEIVEPYNPVPVGKIRNCNGPMLVALTESLGCRAKYLGIADDVEDKLTTLIEKGLENDILLMSGGVSMGDYDLVPKVLESEGVKRLFHKVMVKPGKPLFFGKKAKTIAFGIPGNPVSNFTTFNIFIKPAIHKLMGRSDYMLNIIDGFMAKDFTSKSNRVHIVPSIYKIECGRFRVKPFNLNGSADIIAMSNCNCLIMIDKGLRLIKKNDPIRMILLDN